MAKGKQLICKKCGSENITVQAIAEQKKRGCLASILWIFLALCTLGAVIWIPLLMKKGSKTQSYAICQNCGNRWKV